MITADELKQRQAAKSGPVLKDIENKLIENVDSGKTQLTYDFPENISDDAALLVIQTLAGAGYMVNRTKGYDQRDGAWDFLTIAW